MAGLTIGMASEVPNQPNSPLTANDRKRMINTGTGEGQNVGQEGGVGDDKGTGTGMGRRTPRKCLPKSSEILTMPIKSKGLEANIQYMKDHALKAKFVGIWPIEKNVIWWVNHHWKPRGGYELRLGAK
jgi:hypothetical protein